MANNHVVLVQADEWSALYVDGVSVCQGKHIDIRDLKRMVEKDTPLENIHYSFSDTLMDYSYDHGNLPDTYTVAKQHDPELP